MRNAERVESGRGHRIRRGRVAFGVLLLCGGVVGLVPASASAAPAGPADTPSLVVATNPAFDEVEQGAPCDTVPLYDNSGPAGDDGDLGVGDNAFGSCAGTVRAYYQFQLPSVINGATIDQATVEASEVYSTSCTATKSIDLSVSGPIGAGTDWNSQPPASGPVASAAFGPAYNQNCPNHGVVDGGFDVTTSIQQAASGQAPTVTVVLTDDSGSATQFARFSDNPVLQISYTPAAG